MAMGSMGVPDFCPVVARPTQNQPRWSCCQKVAHRNRWVFLSFSCGNEQIDPLQRRTKSSRVFGWRITPLLGSNGVPKPFSDFASGSLFFFQEDVKLMIRSRASNQYAGLTFTFQVFTDCMHFFCLVHMLHTRIYI